MAGVKRVDLGPAGKVVVWGAAVVLAIGAVVAAVLSVWVAAAASIVLAAIFAYVGWLGIHEGDGEPHRSFRLSDGDHDVTDTG